MLAEITVAVVGLSTFLGAVSGIAVIIGKWFNKIVQATLKPLNDKIDIIDKKVDNNEADRIRSEIERYYHLALQHVILDEKEKEHIDKIYRKYHEELHQNGEISHEYEYIIEHFEKQFEGE